MSWAWISIAISAAQIVMMIVLIWAFRQARRLCRLAQERLVLADQLLAEVEGHKAAVTAAMFAAQQFAQSCRLALIDIDDEDDGHHENGRGPPLH